MKPRDFMKHCVRLDMPDLDYSPVEARLKARPRRKHAILLRLLHASMGISGESGEIADTIKKSMMYGKPIDSENLKEEAGDLLWYVAILLNALGLTFEDAMRYNVEKLRKRYPTGNFNEKAALERADKTEEAV